MSKIKGRFIYHDDTVLDVQDDKLTVKDGAFPRLGDISGISQDNIIKYDEGTGKFELAELSLVAGEVNTASNVGTGVGVYKEKASADLRFHSIMAGDNITITLEDNDIVIKAEDLLILDEDLGCYLKY